MRPLAARLILLGLGVAVVSALSPGRTSSKRSSSVRDAAGRDLDGELPTPEPYRPPRSALAAGVVILIAAGAGYAVYGYERMQSRYEEAARLAGGDPVHGRASLVHYGCAGCHTIPGIQRANGLVGPDLGSLPRRLYIAGRLENSTDNLVRWIVDPKAVDPQTAMPRTGISESEARDVVAYLYAMP